MEAYAEALGDTPRVEIGASRTRAGSVAAAIVGYLGTADFHNLASASQREYRRVLEGLRREHGERSIRTLERRHVVMMLDAKAETPTGARGFLRCLRLLIKYAINIGLRQDDPTAGVRVRVPKSEGFVTWSDEEIVTFETYYPLGTKPRLALALLLNTAARVSDTVRLGRQHVRNGALHFTQQKTGGALAIPIGADLTDAINAAAPTGHLTYLINEYGRAFTPASFSKWFAKQCRHAGLKGRSAHGLRKAACRRLAEAGCSANEIAAISGHASLNEVARYTRAADQARLARNALARTAEGASSEHRLSNLAIESGKPVKKCR